MRLNWLQEFLNTSRGEFKLRDITQFRPQISHSVHFRYPPFNYTQRHLRLLRIQKLLV